MSPVLKQTWNKKHHIDTASTMTYSFHTQGHIEPWSESIVTRKYRA